MTLDEAIKHEEEIAERLETSCKRDWMGEDDKRCAEEHRQIAEWLKELKAYREQGNAVMDGILKIIHSTIYDFMDVCDDDESPLTDKDKLLLSINKAICNNLKSMHEQFERNIREFEVKLESGVKIDRGPLLQRKNAAWEIKEDLIRREEALEIIRTSETERERQKYFAYLDGVADGLNESSRDIIGVLDKIRAEIEKAVREDIFVSLDGTDEVRIPSLDPDDVFEIIDKYKAEVRDKE